MTEARRCGTCGAELSAEASPQGLCARCLLEAGLKSTGVGVDSRQETSPAAAGQGPIEVAELSRLFPQLEIQRLLGRGGMGAVYLARQKALDRPVALKLLAPKGGSDPEFAERFAREARALARLAHPNIVSVYDSGVVEGLYFFLMEHVDGTSLREVMRKGKLAPREALALVPQICDALQYAHDEGVVHRDIKPENILLDKKGRIKIADFGLAKILGTDTSEAGLTGSRHVMGTPHYMAPEQLEHPKSVDHRADIYSLGVVFYEMLTGELPLGRFAPPSKKVRVDVRLDDVVLRALEKEPERRYQHVSEVKTDVEEIENTEGQGEGGVDRARATVQAKDESEYFVSGLWNGTTLPRTPKREKVGIGAFAAVWLFAVLGMTVGLKVSPLIIPASYYFLMVVYFFYCLVMLSQHSGTEAGWYYLLGLQLILMPGPALIPTNLGPLYKAVGVKPGPDDDTAWRIARLLAAGGLIIWFVLTRRAWKKWKQKRTAA